LVQLLSIQTDNLSLPIGELVGTLLFAEFPTTIVYVGQEGVPIMKEWVDCSDEGDIDRYFYYKTSKYFLKNFIAGKLSHQDLILNATDGLLYFQDIKNGEPLLNFIISSNHLPSSYKPSGDFFLHKNDGVEVERIETYFNLKDYSIDIAVVDKIKEISYTKKNETINIHLHQGNGVGFGTINTNILGKTLIKFDKLYKDIGLDFFIGKNRGEVPLTQKQKEDFEPYISTEIYGSLAASYSVLLRPISSRYNLFNERSDTELIAQKVFSLISNSNKPDLLQSEYVLHSDFTINSYKGFLKQIYEMELDIELNWFSPVTGNELNEGLDYRNANSILENIENLNVQTEDNFSKKGKFRAINCDTGHFIFISNDNEQFTGYFDKQIKEGSELITFVSIYEIKISRKILKEPGRVDAKIIDTIIAFFEDKN
jgi:hypothetical protein